MLVGSNVASTGAKVTVRLFDGTNLVSGEVDVAAATSTYTSIDLATIYTNSAASTVSLQAACNFTNIIIRPSTLTNAAGSTATKIVALRIA